MRVPQTFGLISKAFQVVPYRANDLLSLEEKERKCKKFDYIIEPDDENSRHKREYGNTYI